MSLKSSYYKTLLLSISRGNTHGVFSNAKPLMMLAIIDAIEDGVIIGNKIKFIDKNLETKYKLISKLYEPQKSVTNIAKPFFHLSSEVFYYIKYNPEVNIPTLSSSPSATFLRNNVEFAALEDELWDLLQNKDVRCEYREAMIQHFLK